MKLTIEEIHQEINNIYSIILQPAEPLVWQAGQYAIYKIPHNNPDNRGETRIFTISSAPFQKKVMLTTNYSYEESSSFKKALFAKKIGDEVEILKIDGKFTVNNNAKKLVFIAGGIGITPFHSILLQLKNQKDVRDIIMVYSNKDENKVIFKDALDRLAEQYTGLKIIYIFSPQRANEDLIIEKIPDFKERIFYLSGPLRLVQAVEDVLKQLNIVRESIKKDYFPGLED